MEQIVRNNDYPYRVEVCFMPGQYPLYAQDMGIVVVIDVLRATSAMVAAFENGVDRIIPVSTIEEARQYIGREGFIAAAERNGASPARRRCRVGDAHRSASSCLVRSVDARGGACATRDRGREPDQAGTTRHIPLAGPEQTSPEQQLLPASLQPVSSSWRHPTAQRLR